MAMTFMDWIKGPSVETDKQRIGQLVLVETHRQIEQDAKDAECEETKENRRRGYFANNFAGKCDHESKPI